jgi:hypothetical protein
MKVIPDSFCDCAKIKKLKLPECVTKIGNRAFVHCRFKKIVLPKNLKSIGNEGFGICKSLSEVQFNSKLESIGEDAFWQTKLTEVTIPDSVKYCGSSCFSLSSVSKIKFSKNMKSIPGGIFFGSKIKNVVIPGKMKSVGRSAFSTKWISTVELQEGVECIDETSFASKKCTKTDDGNDNNTINHKMVDVSVPKSLKNITASFLRENPEEQEKVVFQYSKNADFKDAKTIQLGTMKPKIDLKTLEKGSKLYVRFVHTYNELGYISKNMCTEIIPFCYNFK